MKLENENFYIITGGPGVGKTTLLNELQKEGHQIVPEVAREIIKQQMETNGTGLPWKDKELYLKLILEASLKSYLEIQNQNSESLSFFDRGIPDSVCYSKIIEKEISFEINSIAQSYRYNKNVFILPPWQEIYQTDSERKQTWQEAKMTYNVMKETYLSYNYQVIDIPKDSIENRKRFVLDFIRKTK
ncbi:ATPase [Pedobacter sp. HMWF019]|uniref:AAA family ATPase n=1 Tax=Pedobacter sp. HMWF019 TaxID=2056856 RepID=UPI000D36AD20|nr:AAA family ATPase [Pedobacter sp. HMWF019]PTS99709.1 ATPase [Pedobacter sp. HMWF019]